MVAIFSLPVSTAPPPPPPCPPGLCESVMTGANLSRSSREYISNARSPRGVDSTTIGISAALEIPELDGAFTHPAALRLPRSSDAQAEGCATLKKEVISVGVLIIIS